jgi:hypothetical protein
VHSAIQPHSLSPCALCRSPKSYGQSVISKIASTASGGEQKCHRLRVLLSGDTTQIHPVVSLLSTQCGQLLCCSSASLYTVTIAVKTRTATPIMSCNHGDRSIPGSDTWMQMQKEARLKFRRDCITLSPCQLSDALCSSPVVLFVPDLSPRLLTDL